MKTHSILILSFIIFITPCISQERFRSGSYALGGGVGYSQENYSSKYFDYNSKSISIKPRISYFIFNNISADLQFGFGSLDEDGEYYDDRSWYWQKYQKVNSDLSIGLGSSFYLPLENTYPFIRAGISYYYRYAYSIANKIDNETILNTSLGLAVFVSNSVALEPEFGYDHMIWSENSNLKNIYWFSFGITYYVYEFGVD